MIIKLALKPLQPIIIIHRYFIPILTYTLNIYQHNLKLYCLPFYVIYSLKTIMKEQFASHDA